MKKAMISFVIDGDVLSHVDEIAEANQKSRSQILREAVARHVTYVAPRDDKKTETAEVGK